MSPPPETPSPAPQKTSFENLEDEMASLLGRPKQMLGGAGFSENADKRRLEMQLRLAFWFLGWTATTLKRRRNSNHLITYRTFGMPKALRWR